MSTVAEFKTKGNDAFKAKNYKEAISNYTKAIELDHASPESGALYSNRAASYNAIGEYNKALEDAESCIRVRPDWLKGYYRKGTALESLKRLDEAVKAFQEAAKTEPGNEDVNEKIAALNEAIKVRNAQVKPEMCSTPEEARTIGNSFFGLGKYEVAMNYYGRAIDLYNKSGTKGMDLANCYTNRAACHQQTHAYKSVVEDCNAALAIEPNHVKALLRRAIAYEGTEKFKLALEDYNTVNRLSPGMSNVSQGIVRCKRNI